MRSTTKMAAVLIALLVLFVAACGSTDSMVEKLVEEGSEGAWDVDISDGDVTINVETEAGTVSVGSGGEVPEELEIPVPDGGDVVTSLATHQLVSVSLTYDQDRFDEIVGFYETWTDGTGDEWDSQTLSMDTGEGTQRTNMWDEAEGNSMIAVTDCAASGSGLDDFDAVCLTVTRSEKSTDDG